MPPTCTYYQRGEMIDHTPVGAVTAGDVVVVGERAYIAPNDIAAGTKGALAASGVWKVPKPTGVGTDYDNNTEVFWDVADTNAQDDADTGTNKHLGRVVGSPATTDETMYVELTPA